MRFLRFLKCFALASLMAFAATAQAQKTQLLVYTALETDQLKAYQEGFNRVHPDIEIKWVRDSTGVITAKLLAEKANPQADAVMGVAASSLALLDKQGMLEPYAPLNLDAIMSQYRDKKKVPAWFGMDDLAQARSSFAEQAVIFRRKHNWLLCWLYVGSFGSFIGFAAAGPLLLRSQFPAFDGGQQAVWLGPVLGALRVGGRGLVLEADDVDEHEGLARKR